MAPHRTAPVTSSGIVTLLTDFGPGSVYVGQMRAAVLSRGHGVRVVDLAHDCPFADIAAAAYLLRSSFAHFPVGSVHVAVVDPGVGGARDVLAAWAHGHGFVAPDNGLLGALLAEDPAARVRVVEEGALTAAEASPTFHGRDICAPIAAHLALGGVLDAVGPPGIAALATGGPRVEADGIAGRVLLVDAFGTLITDIPAASLGHLAAPRALRVRVGGARIDGLSTTFGDVEAGRVLGYVGSGGHLEVAVNRGRAADVLGLAPGAPVRVERLP